MLYDEFILVNDRGNQYRFAFVHGFRGGPSGETIDSTEIVSIYQSADSRIFEVQVLGEEAFEQLKADLMGRRGYRVPGSDTQSKTATNLGPDIIVQWPGGDIAQWHDGDYDKHQAPPIDEEDETYFEED